MNHSIDQKYPLATARRYAQRVVDLLAPHCEQIAIAGSIRRNKPEVKDIEVVCIPKRTQIDLFGGELVPIPSFCKIVNGWEKVKGEPTGKYTQRLLPGSLGIKLDLFIATPENWGFIFAIRTGSANYSAQTLGRAWRNAGYEGKDGMLVDRKTLQPVPTPTEKDFFKLINLDWVEPENRK